MAQSKPTAFELLREIANRSIETASPLPQRTEVRETWDGIGFRVGNENFVVPLDQVSEILTYISITAVPGAKEWVKGIANVRGNLLAISDFSGFVQNKVSKYTKKSQILVIHHKDIQSGLIVDEVFGLRHFFTEDFLKKCKVNDDNLQRFIRGGYKQGENLWPVVDIFSIVDEPGFRQVSA